MQGRVGVVVLLVALFAAGLAAGVIHAGPTGTPPSTTTPDTSTEPPTETSTSTTASPDTTTTSAATTTVAPARSVLTARPPSADECLLVGAFALRQPAQPARMLGPTVRAPRVAEAGAVGYPENASIVSADSLELSAGGCGSGSVAVHELSLFGGALTADAVTLTVRGNDVASRITGLAIRGKHIAAQPGVRLRLGSWGYAFTLARAPLSGTVAALAVQLRRAHGRLPAGTVVQVSLAIPSEASPPERARAVPPSGRKTPEARRAVKAGEQRAAARKKKRDHARKRPAGRPLTLTPRLGVSNYVFPVAGESSYIDSYGGFRGDVPGNWHHGDDIFAAVGTPVVAVADGTLNRVGWERLGGWRLWVRDAMRNEFYYAHLSGYSPLALHSKRVRAGDVIGFIGNTGDAFTTSPHLHFEIHPHQLLALDYNGAVDPTRYIDTWQHVSRTRAPTPVHPPFPRGAVHAEAGYVWRQLLAARGLTSQAPKASERPRIRVPVSDAPKARRLAAVPARAPASHDENTPAVDVLAGLIAPGAAFGLTLLLRRRRKPS